MTDSNDIDGLAGEYVLGTLGPAERAEVSARRQREGELDRAIRDWERRLAPLNAATSDVQPPSGLFDQIVACLAGSSPMLSADVVDLTRRMRRWRLAAIAATAAAAGLAWVIGAAQFAPKPQQGNLVAILQKDANSPAFLVTVNVVDRVMTVRPVAAKHEAGKSHELWIIHDSLGKPKSLGVIDEAQATRGATLASYAPDVIAGSTYAVTLEPEGGSPTGAPTGPIVFAGKMIEQSDF